MASFLDQAPSFNPYVQQLPIEAMVDVGMRKQQMYDEGITKIQSHIDSVAGFDVARDIDKQYLQGRLNELGNKLKVVSGGDFSNFQLQNSVNGMTNQIAKDSNVVNAVMSTRKFRKGMEDMEAYHKEGKGSPSNDWFFQRQVNDWMNSQYVKKSFNAKYEPYTNYKKNAIEIVKALTGDSSITDDAFTVDSKGNMVIADAIVRKSMKGISPEKIQQALITNLTPADLKQMEIDGMYNYANVPDQDFVNRINASYSKEYKYFSDMKTVLTGAISTTKSVPQKAQLNDKINEIDKKLKSLTSEYNNISGTFQSGDTDSAKARLHSMNFMDQFAKAFSFTETSQTYHASPFAEAARWREDRAWDKQKFFTKLEQDERFKKIDVAMKQAELDAESGGVGYGGFPKGIKEEDLPVYTIKKLESDVANSENQMRNADDDFIRKVRNVKSVTPEDREWLETQYAAWLERPDDVEAKLRTHFERSYQNRRKYKSDVALLTQIENDVAEKFPTISGIIPEGSEGIKFKTSTGRDISFSPEDLVEFNDKLGKYRKITSSPSGGRGIPTLQYSWDDEAAAKELTKDELILYNVLKKKDSKQSLNEVEENIANLSNQYFETVNQPYKRIIQEANDYKAQLIQERTTVSQGQSFEIPTDKPNTRRSIQKLLSDVMEESNIAGGFANSPDLNVDILSKAINDPNVVASITVGDGTQYQEPYYNITVTSEGQSTSFRLTPEQKRAVFGDRFEAPIERRIINPYLEQIRKMGGVSTSYDGSGETNIYNSYLTKSDFPSVKKFGITGNIATFDDGGNYSLMVNIFDPLKKEWIQNIDIANDGLTPEQLTQYMSRLTDVELFNIIYERAPTAEDMKKIEESSKIPF